MEDIKNIIESILFVADDPLTVDQVKKVLPDAETKEIRSALSALVDEYENRNGGFDLREVAGGYQFRTRREYREWIVKFIQPNPIRLSKAALETLAIIAYRQPVIRSDVEHIRGVDSGGIIRTLLERKLIRVLGRKDIPGRPLIYTTTKQFLEIFDLKDLKDLPTPKEIEEMGKQASEENPSASEDITEKPEGAEPEAAGQDAGDGPETTGELPSEKTGNQVQDKTEKPDPTPGNNT